MYSIQTRYKHIRGVNIIINLMFFIVMYNIHLHIECLPWDTNTFRWLIHDNRLYNRIYLYEILSLFTLLLGYLCISNILSGGSWFLIIIADKVGYVPGNYTSSNYSPDRDYGWVIYILGMLMILLIGCAIEIVSQIKNKKKR